jgi:hypothetical protein
MENSKLQNLIDKQIYLNNMLRATTDKLCEVVQKVGGEVLIEVYKSDKKENIPLPHLENLEISLEYYEHILNEFRFYLIHLEKLIK